ncbi:hypothetical protein HYDPIDRAFT_34731 [Hydnomerulius pinastri MD-312]|uniref:Ubiquitin-like protease family profile domain-containing protein n=1 Tax=Hydnomerulius pinastri MD-312 TaxID=994086 RepID=A0A0C9UXU4_9AGAM|nr:hypothetical protein HYDPIDRAFT_34731 [Hydnomerulius pinastri MD-312]
MLPDDMDIDFSMYSPNSSMDVDDSTQVTIDAILSCGILSHNSVSASEDVDMDIDSTQNMLGAIMSSGILTPRSDAPGTPDSVTMSIGGGWPSPSGSSAQRSSGSADLRNLLTSCGILSTTAPAGKQLSRQPGIRTRTAVNQKASLQPRRNTSSDEEQVPQPPVQKRGRGRPPKRRPGRNKKGTIPVVPETAGKQARPALHEPEHSTNVPDTEETAPPATSSEEEEAPPASMPPPVQKRRRGRPPKRQRGRKPKAKPTLPTETDSSDSQAKRSPPPKESLPRQRVTDEEEDFPFPVRPDSPNSSSGSEYTELPPVPRSPFPELSPERPPLVDIAREDIGARVMAKPALWTNTYEELHSLNDKCWIDISVASYYLASIWHEAHGNTAIRFAHAEAVKVFFDQQGQAIEPSLEEMAQFMHDHYIPLNAECPLTPIAFLVHAHQHFFAVIFDYANHTAYILGKCINPEEPAGNQDWNTWDGPHYWLKVARLHLWDAGDPTDVRVFSRDWPQNGYDCGPTACAVLQRCLQDGLERTWRSLLEPNAELPCGHILRQVMLAVVKARCLTSYRDYMHFRTNPPLHWDEMDVDEATLNRFASGGNIQRDNNILRTLIVASNSCRMCRQLQRTVSDARGCSSKKSTSEAQQEREQEEEMQGEVEEVEDPEVVEDREREEEEENRDVPSIAKKGGSRERSRALLALLKNHKVLQGARDRHALRPRAIGSGGKKRMEENEEDGENGDEEGQEEGEPGEGIPMQVDHDVQGQRSNAAQASRKRVKGWHLGSLQRFPRRTEPVPLPSYRGQRFLERDYNFDKYDHGPTIEMLQPPEVYSIFALPYESMTKCTAWTMWRDHGYRLLPSSFQMFYLGPPIKIMEHVMTIGEVEGYPMEQVSDRVTGDYQLGRSGAPTQGSKVNVHDVEIMSASEMLYCAGEVANWPNISRDGHNTFVRGRLSIPDEEEKYICVDLEKDGLDFNEHQIDVSVDIDSIIWTTKEFVCRDSIGVHMTPVYTSKPGIFKHNHVYVDVLIPQSEWDQQQLGRRTEWLSKKFPMTAIPHTLIGRLGSASVPLLDVVRT